MFKADGDETAQAYSISEWWLDANTKGPGARTMRLIRRRCAQLAYPSTRTRFLRLTERSDAAHMPVVT